MSLKSLTFLPLCAVLLSGCALRDAVTKDSDSGGKAEAAVDDMTRNAAKAADAVHDFDTASGNWGILYQHHSDDSAIAQIYARDLRYAARAQEAIDVSAGFIERHPSDPVMTAELGKDYLAASRFGLAERTLRQASEMSPQDWQILSALGVTLDYLGSHAQAQEVYRRGLALAHDNPTLLNNLALSQAQSGKLADALVTLKRAVEQPAATTQMRQNLALVEAYSGNPEMAERLSRQDLPPEMARANAEYFKLLSGTLKP